MVLVLRMAHSTAAFYAAKEFQHPPSCVIIDEQGDLESLQLIDRFFGESMSTDISQDRYSKLADFELLVGGRSYRVCQVGRDFILLDCAEAIPPGPALLLIRVEGEDEIRRGIQVLPGDGGGSRRVAIDRE